MVKKMNFRILIKNHAADPEIGFLTKSYSKPYVPAMAMPTAWDLRQFGNQNFVKSIKDPEFSQREIALI